MYENQDCDLSVARKKVLVRFKRPRQTVAFSVFLCLLLFLFHFRSFFAAREGKLGKYVRLKVLVNLLACLLTYSPTYLLTG